MRRPLFLLACLAACATAHVAPSPPRQARLQYHYDSETLENGLRVVILPDPASDLVYVDMSYQVGAVEDPEGKAGLAHLVEHVTFDEKTAGAQGTTLSEALGAQTLYDNAETDYDETHYLALVARDRLATVLDLESRRAVLCNTVDEETFAREREIVRNEVRQRSAGAGILQALLAATYPEGHPYRRLPGGDDEQVAALTRDDACAFLDAHYVPRRATLVLAGNIDPEEGIALAREKLGWLPDRPGAERAALPPLGIDRKTIKRVIPGEEPAVIVAWALPQRFTDWDLPVRLAWPTIDERIGKIAREDWAADAGLIRFGGERAPVALAYVTLSDASKADAAIKAIDAAVAPAELISRVSQEIIRERNLLLASLLAGFEPLDERARAASRPETAELGGGFFLGELTRASQLTWREAGDAVTGVFDPKHELVLVVQRGKGKVARRRAKLVYTGSVHEETGAAGETEAAEGTETAEETEETEEAARLDTGPIPVPEHVSVLPRARRYTLKNGMKVVLLPFSTVPRMSVRLVYRAGLALQPAGKAGVADVAAGLIHPDVDENDDLETQWQTVHTLNAFYDSGTRFRSDTDLDATVLFADGLGMFSDQIVRGMAKLLDVGDYRNDDLERYKAIASRRFARPESRQRLALARALRGALYGPSHPYGPATVETQESISSLTAGDARSFFHHLSPANATLIVTGGFDEDLVVAYIDETFAHWGAGTADAPVTTPLAKRTGPQYLALAGGDPEVVELTVAYPVAHPIDADYAGRLVLRAMLDQRVGAVRDTLAASYGVDAHLEAHEAAGAYVVEGAIDAERAGEALRVIRGAVSSLRDGADFDADFVAARRAVVEHLAVKATDTDSVASWLTFLAGHDLPPEYLDRLVAEVAALKADEVRRLAQSELAAPGEVVAARGPKDALTAMFQAVELTPVTWIR